MGRQDTETPDVSEGGAGSEVLIVGTILFTGNGVTIPSRRSGVVCRINWSENKRHTEITVGLDKSRWREIPAGGDEEQPVVNDSTLPRCAKCRREMSFGIVFDNRGVCESCW